MYRGVASLVGMDVVPHHAHTVAEEFEAAAQAWNDYDFLFIHVKYTDSRGEDGNFDAKKAVIEEVDAALPTLLALKPDVLVVTGDHCTPSQLRAHSGHPVPLLLWAPATARRDRSTGFGERECARGGLGTIRAADIYMTQIAAARTFTIYEDIEELLKLGKIKGGSLDCAVVIRGDKIISKEGLRFKDEFVRHKILDIIGDITLLGLPLRAHIIATRPGHAINADLTKALAEKLAERQKGPKKKPRPAMVMPDETALDIRRILDTLPHRYPFVMIDRVVEFIGEDALVAIKNVSINEPYFQGHFPNNPVMPGVLQLEAMAQAAGILMLRRGSSEGKTSLFMSADKVKFRKPVRPGDQLILNAKLTKTRGTKLATAEVTCTVDGQVVSSGELMFAIVDSSSVD
jgi:beta-hydroxyacyl-ACP dehydratase FabZ